jgi:hypothetical protein
MSFNNAASDQSAAGPAHSKELNPPHHLTSKKQSVVIYE